MNLKVEELQNCCTTRASTHRDSKVTEGVTVLIPGLSKDYKLNLINRRVAVDYHDLLRWNNNLIFVPVYCWNRKTNIGRQMCD